MKKPILCYVTDRRLLPSAGPGSDAAAQLLDRVEVAARAGVDWIQLREKDLGARSLFDLASRAAAAPDGKQRPRILVNDRVDVAWAAGAAGVHLGENSLPISEVARLCRQKPLADFLIGASCHSLESVRQAAADGADYLFFGPVFATPSKQPFGAPQGLRKLAEACASVSIPVLAIGGITVENAADCLRAGASGIAAIRLFQEAPDLAGIVSRIRS